MLIYLMTLFYTNIFEIFCVNKLLSGDAATPLKERKNKRYYLQIIVPNDKILYKTQENIFSKTITYWTLEPLTTVYINDMKIV